MSIEAARKHFSEICELPTDTSAECATVIQGLREISIMMDGIQKRDEEWLTLKQAVQAKVDTVLPF